MSFFSNFNSKLLSKIKIYIDYFSSFYSLVDQSFSDFFFLLLTILLTCSDYNFLSISFLIHFYQRSFIFVISYHCKTFCILHYNTLKLKSIFCER